ncbi:hypothetical protein KOR34_31610 [Posidoniimonas corsicana]|uniref:Uncharacterized protein n=1 Tax=Posidoniimonas corsicana TaxID=1938618 RepID=A0A5C5VJM8_9BACT|nr:hypothetical protein [Posidoniimonas corsicana]TWT38193.1 hypothetical protein KOR34_31610 [Posidoniimonas corsicana]
MTSDQERPAGEAGSHGGPAPTPEPGGLRPANPPDEPWPAIGVGIAVSAGLYPCVALVPAIGVASLGMLITGDAPGSLALLERLAASIAMTVVVGMILIFVTAVVCVPVLFVIWSMVRLLGLHLTWPAAGAFGGSAVAFAYFAPICYLGLQDLHWQLGGMVQPVEFVMLVVVVAIGPLLAVFVGQVGGAYGGVGIEQQRESLGLPGAVQYEGRMAFSIRQLLGLTVVVSLLLAALRLAGLLNSATFFLVGCWLVWHVVSRRLAIALARRLRRNRPGRGLLTMPATPTSGAPEPPVAGGS